jgi:hypothetical protein
MLREAQHARIFVNHFKSISARPETCMMDVEAHHECSISDTMVEI